MLLKTDFDAAARIARISANQIGLAAMQGSADGSVPGPGKDALIQTIAKVKAFQETPQGQGLPSTNESPRGWTTNAWPTKDFTDPAFAGWAQDSAGLWQPPANYTPPPPLVAAIDLLKPGDHFQLDGQEYVVFGSPFGNMKKLVGPIQALPPAPAPGKTAESVLAALVAYAQDRLSKTADPTRQDEIALLLTFAFGLK
jgi:hypothetical protein